jgi:O-antigen/teichoic acid export membrane protein
MLSNTLGAHAYGDFKVAYAFAFLCSVFVVLGGDRAAPKYLAGPLSRGDNRVAWEYMWLFVRVAAVLSAVVIALTVMVSALHLGEVAADEHHALAYLSFTVPLIAVGALLARLLQSAKLLSDALLPWRIGLPAVMIALLVGFGAFLELTLYGVMLIAGSAVVVVVGWLWWRARRRGLLEIHRYPSLLNPRSTLAAAIPMMAAMVLTLALTNADLFLFEALGDEDEVGHFAAAAATAHWIFLAQMAVTSVFAPLIPLAMSAGGQLPRELFWRAQKWVVSAAALLGLVVMAFAPQLLSLFGAGFDHAATAVRLLTLAYVVSCLAAPSSIWLQYSGRGRTVVVIGVAALILDVAGNLLLIPSYGYNGAAAATAIAMAFYAAAIMLAMAKQAFAPTAEA